MAGGKALMAGGPLLSCDPFGGVFPEEKSLAGRELGQINRRPRGG